VPFDLRYVLRRIARFPGSALIVILSLGVGMGAVAAMLGVVDTLFFRPPPGVRDPARLVAVMPRKGHGPRATYPDYLDLRSQATSYSSMGAYASVSYSTRIGKVVVPAQGMLATSSLLSLLGVRPAWGRDFVASDDQPGAPGVVLVNPGFWNRAMGTNAPALGATIYLADQPFTVIGVLPERFASPDLAPVDLMLPIANAPWFGGTEALRSRNYRGWLQIVGRLRPGVGAAQAETEATAIYRRVNQSTGYVDQGDLAHTVAPVLPIIQARQDPDAPVTRMSLWITLLAAAVLLIACANVATLLLARGVRERHALAIHAALGAPRGRVIGRVLLELAVLVSASTILALSLTRLASNAITSLLLANTVSPPSLDVRMAVTVLGVALVTTLFCAIAPVSRAWRLDPRTELATGSSTSTRSHRLAFRSLLVGQSALCFVLVAEAILFAASLRNAMRSDLGVKLDHLLIADADLHAAGLSGADALAAVRRALAGVSALPGVRAAGMTDAQALPSYLSYTITIPDADSAAQAAGPPPSMVNGVTAAYLDALGLPLIAGRALNDADVTGARPVALISEAMARRFWPRATPLGACVKVGDASATCSMVVGVVGDRHAGPGDVAPDVEVYVPLGSPALPKGLASIFPGREVAVRVTGDIGPVESALRTALLEAVPQLTSVRVRTGEDYLERQFRSWRLGAGILSAFGVVALALAAVGVFGVSACVVDQRRRELGIRGALGASPMQLASLVLSESFWVNAAGVALGLGGAFAVARAVRSLAFGVSPLDARLLGVVALVLVGTTLLSALWPALRAAAVDPTTTLRSE
jgi:predicted permease